MDMGNAKHICLAVAGFVLFPGWIDAASQAFQNDIAGQNPLVWYKLNQPAGSSIAINSGSLGSSLNGTAFNNPTFGAPADGGDTGVAFANGSGQQQYIQTANNVPASLQGNPTFTVEVLVYLPSQGQPSIPVYAPFLWWGGNGTGNSVYFSLSHANYNQVFVGFYNSGLVMTGAINLDAWNLITWVRDSNGGTNNSLTGSTLYINGVVVATTSDPLLSGRAGVFPTVQPGPITIERAGDFSRYFTGTVADAAVFPTALSAAVIAHQYADLTGTSTALPTIAAVVNGASFVGGGVVPGEVASVFGINLTSSTGINVTSGLPLPTTFLRASVIVNNQAVALFAVDNVNGQQQINFQVPWEVASGPNATFAVTNNDTAGASVSFPVLAAQPGIFNYTVGNDVFGAILHASFATANTADPAKPGETVLIYCTGLGAVSPEPADGAAGNGEPTTNTPTVTMGSMQATVSFSGLAPGFVGLYQINAVVPAGLAAGNQPVVVTVAGAASNSVLLPVQ